jgi:fibronectin type 3 domain-containing protein
VLIVSLVIQTFLFPLTAVSAASLSKLHVSGSSDTPDPFSPNGDGRLDVVKITSALNIEGTGQTSNAVLKGELAVNDSSDNQVASLEVGEPLDLAISKWDETTFSAVWDGKTSSGEIAADGTYFYTVNLSLLKGCKGNGDNRDDLHSGHVDLLGDCNSGEGNDDNSERIIATAGPLSGEITIDNTPPSIFLEGIVDGEFTNRDVIPIIVISDPHMASQSIHLNGMPFISGMTVAGEGHYALSIIAEDEAENSAKVDIEFTIDKTPPTASIISPADGSQVDNSNPQIYIEYSDSMSGIDLLSVTLTVDNLNVTPHGDITETGITYTLLASLQEGTHTIGISVSDMSGNAANTSGTFTIRSRCATVKPESSDINTTSNHSVFPVPGFDSGSYAGGHFTVMEVADVNGDGILDIVGMDRTSSNSRISVLLGKGDGGFEKYASFGERLNSSYISYIALGDFNGDCYPDIAVTRSSPYEFYIFMNNGDGSFTEKAAYGTEGHSALLTGRFDGDGYEDIAVYTESGKVTIFRGNGDGTFLALENLAINSAYSHIIDMAALDLNEDGITDIVSVMGVSDYMGRRGQEIVLLIGTQQGDFIHSLAYSVGDNLYIKELVVGDFNGDGHLDISAVRQPNNYYETDELNITSLLNITSFFGNGTGLLSMGAENSLWSENLVSYYTFQSASKALEINGDKKDDIVINSNGKVYTYISKGEGSFQYSTAYDVFDNYWMHIGDLNDDGNEDIVISGWTGKGYVFVLFNRGDGTFIDRRTVPTGGNVQVASADLDGDGRPDLAITHGQARMGEALFSTILNRGDEWSEEPFQSFHSNYYNLVGGPVAVKLGDLNGDEHLDVVTGNEASGSVAVLINDGNGNLTDPVYYQVGQWPDNVVLTDLNGDDHQDIITVNRGSGNVSVLLGRGDGTFHGQKTFAAGSVPGGLAIGDFNKDGRSDIAVTDAGEGSNEVSILLGKGDGTFRERVVFSVSGVMPSTIKEGDFNNDGISDLAVLYHRSGYCGSGICTAIDLLLGKSDGSFILKNAVVQGGIKDFTSGDFNRDGIIDIVVCYNGSNIVLVGDGNGKFSQTQAFSQSINLLAYPGDINNDGDEDLLMRDAGSLMPWFGQGDGTFRRGVSIGGRDVAILGIGDMNGDAIMDMVAIDWRHKLSIILGTGGGSFQGDSGVANESEPYYSGVNLTTGDFNGDGNQDIAVSMYPSDWSGTPKGKTRVRVYWGSGYNTFVPGTLIESDHYWTTRVFGVDLNADGKMDIALQAHPWDRYGVSVFLNNGDGSFQGAMKYDIESNRTSIKLEDVNSDGYPDLINNVQEGMWGTSSYGVSIHAGNGDGTFRHHHTIPLGERQGDWSLSSQPGDFNNDGHQDIALLFSHYLYESELKIYLSEEGTFDSESALKMNIPYADALFTGDVDDDGNLDLGAVGFLDPSSIYSGIISLYSSNGDATFRSAAHYATGSHGYDILLRDFNLDGRLDMVVPSYPQDLGHINLLYNTLPSLHTPPLPPTALKGVAGDATVTLFWAENSEDGVEGYNVYRSFSAGGGYEKINGALVTIPSYADYTVTNGTSYYYTVSALDEDGEESSYAVKVRAMPQPPDTTAPVVSIVSPVNNQTVTNPSLFISGAINEADARVTVNGKAAIVQKNSGTFTAYGIPLNIGENTIAVTAVDPAGNTSSISINVIYAPTATIEGVVKDENTSIPVPYAWVYVRDSVKEQAFLTKPDGSFSALNVIPGQITITVDGNDYERVIIDRTISPAENLVLDIVLPLYPSTIRGSIYDSHTSAGVGNATLTITDPKKIQTLTADDYGFFEANNIAPYQVTIIVSSAGYETYTTTRTVTNRWTNYLYFYLNAVPPSPPSGFAATPGKGFVSLSWNANSESNIANYNIYRSTSQGAGYQLIASTYSDEFSYADGDVAAGTAYYYVIEAVNTSAQKSGYSAEISAAPEALAIPTGLTATSGKGVVNLAWDAIAESTFSIFNIYRSAESGGGYARIGSVNAQTTSYTDNNVEAGVTYFYVVTAVNAWSREGGWSKEASAVPEELRVSIAITFPYEGAYSAAPTVIVKGTVESISPEVGVVLLVESGGKEGTLSSGYLAEVSGGTFAARITLFPGMMNTIRAIATLPDGEYDEVVITIYAGTAGEAVELITLPPSGIISAQTGRFDVTFEAEVNIAGTITGYSWDFDGDGIIDQVTSTPDAATFGYASPGIYYPTITVTNNLANSYAATTVVNVMSVEAVDAILKAKWDGMKGALLRKDLDKALSLFSQETKELYGKIFTALAEQMPEIAAEFGEIQLVSVQENEANYCIIRDETWAGQIYPISHEIIFSQDENGIWKIERF